MLNDIQTHLQSVIRRYQFGAWTKSKEWNLQALKTDNQERENLKAKRSFEVLGIDMSTAAFQEQTTSVPSGQDVSLEEFYVSYLRSMREDVADCLDDEQKIFLDRVHFQFLNTGVTNAECVDSDVNGKKLPFFIAFINEGLYFSLNQLFAALVFEEMQGDLAAFKRDGTPAFHAALDLYLDPRSPNVGKVGLELENAEAEGEAVAYQSSVTTLVLKFICLHEFAHAFLNHLSSLRASRLSMLGAVETVDNELSNERYHEFEFQADEFAFRAIISVTESVQSHWAHAYVIHLFFRYLEVIEVKLGKPICERHPAPEKRSSKLISLLKQQFPDAAEYAKSLERVDELIRKWTKMLNLEITVQANNVDSLSKAIEAQDNQIQGLDLRITDRRQGLGMATSNELLVIAAAFAGNISAGVIANYFFMKLTRPQDGTSTDKPPNEGIAIFIDDEMASSVDELEIIIRKKQREAEPKE